MRPRILLPYLLLLLSCLVPAAPSLGAGQTEPASCKEFVYLDDKKLMLEDQPFGFKGVNFTLWIGADPNQLSNPDAYFLVPFWSYREPNYSLRVNKNQPVSETCSSETSCRAMLISEHIDRITGLGANSVRLVGLPARFRVEPDGQGGEQVATYFPSKCLWTKAGDELLNCDMDLDDPVLRARYFELVREAINLLGDHGMRTILHTGHASGLTDDGFESYIDWLGEISQAFANEPYLIAYDPMNEPEWVYTEELDDDSSFDHACDYLGGNRPLCKGTAQQVSKAWFDALTAHDSQHLVTIGLSNPYRSTRLWDPYILWDHFTSYHIYADGYYDDDEWLENNGFSESYDFANQIYMASLGGCGLPCPYVGEFDGANCLVAKGQAGQAGSISGGGFFYAPRSGSNPCPGGTLEAGGCKVGEYDPGRDVPWTTTAPIYYVEPSSAISTNHGCPQGTRFDGANCVVGEGPPGAVGFISDGAFYYHRFTGDQQPCSPAHVDEGSRCRVAYIPVDAGPAFILDKALFYVERVDCGPKKPLHFGEIGFTTYRNGVTADRCPYDDDTEDAIGCHL
ncbi:MAG: hypothetical protein KDD11_07155, partial [Acidobacteria bacterium]|nr:hypothetical protein [Acidobacteriota bacterium]